MSIELADRPGVAAPGRGTRRRRGQRTEGSCPPIPDLPPAWAALLLALAACLLTGIVGGLALGAALTRLAELVLAHLAT